MEFTQKYKQLYETVLQEHKDVFEKQDLDELRRFMDAIKSAKRIFLMGVGREGIATRGFAMRLMHLGKETHWIWDDTTPGMDQDDLFIVTNGSGQIGHIHYVVEQARKVKTKIAVITGSPKQKTPRIANMVLFVPACVYNGTDDRVVPSVQPMGNLFEQHLFLLFDVIVMMLAEELKLTHETMASRHRNVE